jgi:DNA-binding NarL/FixJ family response regulator
MAKKKLLKGLWSKGEVALLRKLFPGNPTAKVAVKLGRSLDTVKKKASRMGLKKTKKYLRSLGRT